MSRKLGAIQTDPSGFDPIDYDRLWNGVAGPANVMLGGFGAIVGGGATWMFVQGYRQSGYNPSLGQAAAISSAVTVNSAAQALTGYTQIGNFYFNTPVVDVTTEMWTALFEEKGMALNDAIVMAGLLESLTGSLSKVLSKKEVQELVQELVNQIVSEIAEPDSDAPPSSTPDDNSSGGANEPGGSSGGTNNGGVSGNGAGSSVIIPGRWSGNWCGPGTDYICVNSNGDRF